ncbi:DUF58 domain-containing protein [Algicola sagamiensis]|uniref:DUF58 domain-containing protein n=1 Tax=Algicola sagamiensis TaxID=163869 RepID=UPI000364DB6B|nr:DUF58 domain-containing protein [Algicola sagamiensis]
MFGLVEKLEQFRDQWLDKRMPPRENIQLKQSEIFILPSRFGWIYALATLAIFILGTNYQNNLILLVAYLMGSLFLSCFWFGFYNMYQLKIRRVSVADSYAGGRAAVQVELSTQRARHALSCSFLKEEDTEAQLEGLETPSQVSLSFEKQERGHHSPGRLLIESFFPLGLTRTWTYIDLDIHAYFYPAPQPCRLVHAPGKKYGLEDDGISSSDTQEQELAGLREYKQGEPMSRVAWKQVAKRDGQLLSKELESENELSEEVLSLDRMPAIDLEHKLSQFSYWVDTLQKENRPFHFVLGTMKERYVRDADTARRCLRALATYQNA